MMHIKPNKERLEKVRNQLRKTAIDRLLLLETPNVYYLTGIWPIGQTILSVPKDGEVEILGSKLDLFLVESDEMKTFSGQNEGEIAEELLRMLSSSGDAYVEVDGVLPISGKLESSSNALVRSGNRIVQGIRSVKDEDEIGLLRRSAELARKGTEAALSRAKAGVTEKEVARSAHAEMIKGGADDMAFPISVGSGWRASLPHALPTDKKIQEGDLVVIDLGADFDHYKSDVTRTVGIGAISEHDRRVLDAVVKAYDETVRDVEAGARASDLASKADRVIASAGFSEGILHGLGHGVGLEIHEGPTVNKKNDEMLQAGNVVTVEPGAYLRGITGARWENTLLVRTGGYDVLT